MSDTAERRTTDHEQILARLPRRMRPAAARVLDSWLGRTVRRIAARFGGLELFDRSMTLAAEVFTAVFPILIMAAIWLGSQRSDDIAEAIGMPNETKRVLREALNGSGASPSAA